MTISVDTDVALPITVTIDTAAKLMSVGRSTVYKYLDSAELKSFHLGKKRLIHKDDLEAFINAKRQAA
jgi:excisionase family DNA binding protein